MHVLTPYYGCSEEVHMYTRTIPSQHEINRLSQLVKRYPVSRRDIVKVARMWNFKPEVISFLRQFAPDITFQTRLDLVSRYDELALLIRQERESPKEFLLSP